MAASAGLTCRLCLGIHIPHALGVGVGLALINQHVRLVTVGHWINGNIIVLNALMLGAVNHLPAMLATPLKQLPTLLCPRPPRGSFRPCLPPPPSPPPPAEGLGEGREAPSVMDIKQPRVSSPSSMPMPEHEERGRDTPQVRGEEGDASSTSLASARGGSTQSQPDTLDDKSPPSPSHFRLKISSYHHVDDWGEEGEDRVPSPAPSLPKAKRRREEREQGMDCSRAPDFKKKSTRHRSPTRECPQPRGHDRYAAPAACGLPRCGHCLQGTHTSIGASYALIMIRRSSARTALARGARRSTPSWQRTV